ncbi:ARM repeat-containing protein [Fistulina hepatica ATCC 64428]|uniref:ARM repeat-containing protein n=1 Tax=Fistulina hepatica ATCC 64428 TaxID=1128425 RepID=A0A0D7AEZ2_9AGAR|nr:ARM repeat-containing protein [Fistulina hepatica ATCC 64428]
MLVFEWLCETETRLRDAAVPTLKAARADLESTIVKLISANDTRTVGKSDRKTAVGADALPAPGRALRNVAARCLIILYTRGETRSLFDILQTFLRIASDYKAPSERDMNRIAALSCIGHLMDVFGSQIMSLVAEISTVALKIARSSNQIPLMRYHALVALKQTVKTARRAVPDSTTKDIHKQMRSLLTDKCLPVQRAACEVLVVMYPAEAPATVNDIESILTQSVKSLDTVDQVTRTAHAQLSGRLLASTQVERTVLAPESKPKKGDSKGKNGDADVDVDGDELSSVQAAELTKPLLTPSEMFARLSFHFNRTNISRRTRLGIFDFYVALLIQLGPVFVETNYAIVVGHLMSEIMTPAANAQRYDVLLLRTLVGHLLRHLIALRMLSEQGQIGAIQEFANSYLRRWPALMPGQVAPSPSVLVVALREVAALLLQLGNAPLPVQSAIAEPLVTLLGHPSHSVRVTAAWALRCFCLSTPLRLPKTILTVLDMLQRDITTIVTPTAPSDIAPRTLGHAYGLSALVSLIAERPLYVSYDISAKVLDMAIQLLKRAGDHDIKVGEIEIETAWTLIAALMSLGPNFVRPHLPQLLVLWRNALPKPTNKDNLSGAGRSVQEWMFLLHVRESALGAILCFLRYNGTALVTLDVARRVSSVLSNALNFANGFVSQNVEDPALAPGASTGSGGLSLRTREALLRRRVHQCFSMLGFSGISEMTQTTLLQSTVSLFASPEGYAGSSVQAAIASSTGAFTSVWSSSDGYAYGVTFIEMDDDMSATPDSVAQTDKRDRLNRDSLEVLAENLMQKPILGACEHDVLSILQINPADSSYQMFEPPPPATGVVDTAIELFSNLLPLQDLPTTTRIITELLDAVRSPTLEKNTGRRAAVFINGAVAITLALRVAADALIDGDPVLRTASSESLGRLAGLADTSFLTNQIKQLVDQVVNNRDPNGRAGCALAFGSIYSHVGGLAAGPLLKTTVNVLMSLSNDPHPIVHHWSLSSLARVINAASLAYSPFVSSTLGMLLKVYMMEPHEREGGVLSNSNLGGDFPAYPPVCQIIDAVITILGPDMQESTRTRSLVLNLVRHFAEEDDPGVCVEAIKCIQHFLMFAPQSVDIPRLVRQFTNHLASSQRTLKLVSINALYQLVQKDALAMSKLGGDKLVEDLFGMLDDDASVEGVRNVILSWLQQTVVHNPSAWIDLCQRIMSNTTAPQQVAKAGQGMRDDEGESLNVGTSSDAKDSIQTSRWRTQLFALQCLHEICTIVAESGRKEHFDLALAKREGIPTAGLLVTRIPDLIKMAFTASAAYVTEIRLEGLVVLRDVTQLFAASPDPAYEDAVLLEQYQAPITAALTPAFSSDSTPEILAAAVNACSVFVGSGIVKDVSRMGRILKLLTTALEQSKNANTFSLGESGELGPNAAAMLRITTVTAWAQLQISSLNQVYLKNVIQPYRSTLASLWVASLRDYASVRINSEFLHDTSSVALDATYANLGKEVLLPYYVDAWPIILHAVATVMEADDTYIIASMDGREPPKDDERSASKSNEEPVAYFYVIYGLVYEALSTASVDATSPTPQRRHLITSALRALTFLVRPTYAGNAFKESAIFEEFISLSYRMALTEPPAIQSHLINALSSFAVANGGGESANESSLSPANTHCLRICAHILREAASPLPAQPGNLAERVGVILAAFSTFTSIAMALTTPLREDLRGVGILLYHGLLRDESSDIDLVGPTLPALKALLSIPVLPLPQCRDRFERLIHGLVSSCLLNVDEMRGREGAPISKKIKNNFLASVLVLTVIPTTVKVSLPVVEHCCFQISEKLLEASDLSLTSAHCAKTLIMAASSGHIILRECAKLLTPALIGFIAKMVPHVDDSSVSESHTAAIAEIWKAFSAMFSSIAEEHQTRLLGVLLPTIALLLSQALDHPSPVASAAIVQLLTYATAAPTAFKDAAAKLDAPTRELLERAARQAMAIHNDAASNQASAKPQISLRSF